MFFLILFIYIWFYDTITFIVSTFLIRVLDRTYGILQANKLYRSSEHVLSGCPALHGKSQSFRCDMSQMFEFILSHNCASQFQNSMIVWVLGTCKMRVWGEASAGLSPRPSCSEFSLLFSHPPKKSEFDILFCLFFLSQWYFYGYVIALNQNRFRD